MDLKVPMVSKVDPLEPGQMITVKGIAQGEVFAINLTKGSNVQHEPMDDIGFHMSVRLGEKQKSIVMNSYQNGEWGKEEVHKTQLKAGDKVDIRIRALREQFQVYINTEPAFLFDYRIPIGILNHLNINGSISLSGVQYGKGSFLSVPLEKKVSGLHRGSIVNVAGFLDKNANHFTINLKSGNDIGFHFDVRFKEKAVVRNYCRGGDWAEAEENEGEFPFQKNHFFDCYFLVGEDSYRVEVNDEAFCVFKQHIPAGKIDTLEITGDVDVFRADHN